MNHSEPADPLILCKFSFSRIQCHPPSTDLSADPQGHDDFPTGSTNLGKGQYQLSDQKGLMNIQTLVP